MKPNFALHISDDSVALLHRTARGWLEIGASPLDTPDLGEAMSYLRRSALGLAPHGVATKILIPNSQILYLTLDAPGPDDINRDAQIRRALEGRTPYEVGELVFDWSGDGPHVQVAVIARETLMEAEDFAASFRLNPVSFAAMPEDDRFAGEPWFGPTELAPSLLPEGEQVERDSEAVQIISRAERLASPASAVTSAGAVASADAPEPEPEPKPAETVPPAPDLPAPVQPEIAPIWPEEAEPTPLEQPDPVLPEPEREPEQVPAPEPEYGPAPPEAEPEQPAPAPAELPMWQPDEVPAAPPEPELPFDPPAEEEEAPFIEIDFPDANLPEDPMAGAAGLQAMFDPEETAIEPPRMTGPQVIPPVSGLANGAARAAAPSVAASFASRRRAGRGAAAPLAEPPVTAARKAPAAPLTPPPLSASAPSARPYDLPGASDNDPYDDPALTALPEEDLPPALPPVLQAARAAARQSPAAPPALPAALARRAAQVAAAAPRPAPKAPAAPPKPAKGAQVTAPTIPGLGGRRVKPAVPPALAASAKPPLPLQPQETLVAPPPAAEPPRFAPKARPVRGKPKYLGLMLTVLLLLILVLIGAWSSITLSRNAAPAPDTDVAALAPAEAPAAPEAVIPSAEDEAAADGIAPEDLVVAAAPPVEAPPAESALQPEAGVAAGPMPVLLPGAQDAITLSTMDAQPPALDALALQQPQTAADPAPIAPLPPPPFGTLYAFDANGLIQPTPEGIVTPEGYLLIAGAPPIVPPERPAHIAALAPVADALTPPPADAAPPAADTALVPPTAPFADPALSGFRPRVRPATLAPAPADDAALLPPADPQLAGLKPRARPQSIVAAAEAAEARRLDDEALRVAQAASLSAAAAAKALAEAPPQEEAAAPGPISPLAVAISRLPPQKPRNFSKAVEAAVAVAAAPRPAVKLAEPEPEEPKRTARKAVPGEDEEPDVAVAAAAPKVPSKASVAKNATFVNAIDLGKTNLIGVYGTPAKRYALIRTSAGKYKKVRVGDRLDGGTIAAITDAELRYKKGGRMVTLAMPRG